jgi:hypothetical protein
MTCGSSPLGVLKTAALVPIERVSVRARGVASALSRQTSVCWIQHVDLRTWAGTATREALLRLRTEIELASPAVRLGRAPQLAGMAA